MTKAAILIAGLALLALTMQVETVRASDLSWQDTTAPVEVFEGGSCIDPDGCR